MRKDVRMGFAAGGVLLAVLVVAVLVFHRGKKPDKTVAFDDGGKPLVAPGTDVNAPDSTPRTDGSAPADATSAGPTAAASSANTSTEQKAPADDSAQKGGAQWDALFASTAADPIKAQLTSDASAKPKTKSKKHKPDAATADISDRHDASTAVANAPLDSAENPSIGVPAPAQPVAYPRGTSASPKESNRTHVVAQGETFVSIARAVYGDGRYYQAIVDANPSVTPERLKPGMTIQLPPDSQVKESRKSSKAAAAASSSASDGKTYTVQKDDSLYRIAKKLYGNGEKSADLYEANKQVIGPDSTRLKIGMVLTLPEAPSTR
jgi:nucleoid-associated protein YgaU